MMSSEDSISHLINTIFPGVTTDVLGKTDKLGHADFLVVPGNHGPRWIVPCDPRMGLPVLRQWRPYNLTSMFKWKGLLYLYSGRLLGQVPGVMPVRLRFSSSGSSFVDGSVPVVYVGTPGDQQKAVLTLVNPESGLPHFVLKSALSEGAHLAIRREAEVLKMLANKGHPPVPQLFWIEDDGRQSCQSFIPGRLAGRKFTRRHIDWLLSLPRTGRVVTLDQQREKIERALGDCQPAICEQIEPALKWMSRAGSFPEIIVHGDFAPWNLKRQSNGGISAIDWEEAQFDGVPLHDVCHYFSIQSHLFGGKNAFTVLNRSTLVLSYLENLGLAPGTIRPLLLNYMATMIVGMGGRCSAAYRQYLLGQVNMLLES